GGSGDGIEREWCGDVVGDGSARGLDVQRHLAAEKERRVQAAENDVRVGDRRRGAAAAVARGARPRARATRAHAKRTARIDPRFAAAAGANLDEIDDWRA